MSAGIDRKANTFGRQAHLSDVSAAAEGSNLLSTIAPGTPTPAYSRLSSVTSLKCAAASCSLLCQRPLTHLYSPFPSCPSLAVSEATTSKPRAPLRWLPSSTRRRSPTSSALPPPKCLLSCQRPLTRLYSLTVSHPTPRSQSRNQRHRGQGRHCTG